MAVCVDNGPGKQPTPCLGGVDMSGKNGNSVWVSSNPPPYGKDLAKPYGPGGTFSVELTVTAKDEYTDCAVLKCAIVSRADHTLGADRSQDVVLPITFGGNGNPTPTTTTTTPPPGGGGGDQPGGGTGGTGGTGGGRPGGWPTPVPGRSCRSRSAAWPCSPGARSRSTRAVEGPLWTD